MGTILENISGLSWISVRTINKLCVKFEQHFEPMERKCCVNMACHSSWYWAVYKWCVF